MNNSRYTVDFYWFLKEPITSPTGSNTGQPQTLPVQSQSLRQWEENETARFVFTGSVDSLGGFQAF